MSVKERAFVIGLQFQGVRALEFKELGLIDISNSRALTP
jgi:hypothetical protein